MASVIGPGTAIAGGNALMTLTLEVVGRKAAQMGGEARKVFRRGGTIGRLRDNDWVLPDQYISGHHARISFADGRYYIEDTSTNGVFVNSPQNRIPRGEIHPLNDGDILFVDDYEVHVSLPDESTSPAPRAAMPAAAGADDTDPMRLLGLEDAPAIRVGPRADALAAGSPLSQHYRPPATPPQEPREPPPAGAAPDPGPEDYDPFAADEPPPRPRAPPRAAAATAAPSPPSAPRRHAISSGTVRRVNVPVLEPMPSSVPAPAPAPAPMLPGSVPPKGDLDFPALLAAAGVESARIGPDVSRQFGKIIRVVISGLMDVLQARGKIKDEFRLRLTTFKQKDNNPLKFSANAEDALHNILVKRNAAYLGPVEAFEDAFVDVRNHQMAMLAGMRVAFDAMLAEFSPERLQKEFDAQLQTRSFLRASARNRYWELYCNRFRDTVKDADTAFRTLFGDEFGKAYEEQLTRLAKLQREDRR